MLHTRSLEYVVDEIWKWIFNFMGTQIFFEKISTHILTVLIMRAIVQIEQRKRDKESKI